MEFDGALVYNNDIKGNFVRLAPSVVGSVESAGIRVQDVKVEVSFAGESVALGWDGFESRGEVEINPVLAAKCLGVTAGQRVKLVVSRFSDSEVATEVYLEPESSYDWDLIETNSQLLQDSILMQTRGVTLDRTFICYLESMVAKFTVTKIVPESLPSAKISEGTLVVVAPKPSRKQLQKRLAESQRPKLKLSMKTLLQDSQLNNLEGFSVGVFTDQDIEQEGYGLISLKRKLTTKHKGEYINKIPVKVHHINTTTLPNNRIILSDLVWECLLMSPVNNELLDLELNSFVPSSKTKLDEVDFILRPITMGSTLRQTQQDSSENELPETLNKLKECLCHSVITSNLVFPTYNCFLEIKNKITGDILQNLDLAVLDGAPTSNWKYLATEIKDITVPVNPTVHAQFNFPIDIDPEPTKDLFQELLSVLEYPFNASSGFLIEGEAGMGKTTLLRQLQYKLIFDLHFNTLYIDCNELLKFNTFEKLKKYFSNLISNCYWNQPSILILDNAEAVFPTSKSDDPQQQSQMKDRMSVSTKVASFLMDRVEKITERQRNVMKLLFAVPKKYTLESNFFDRHFISETFTIKPCDKHSRISYLKYFLENISQVPLNLASNLDYSDISVETEGYSLADLKLFTEKLFYDANMKALEVTGELQDELVITKGMLHNCLSSFTPSALRGVKLSKSTGVKWSNIGALNEAKQVLLETLEWPTRYAPIFAKCPLRLRSGILLYGYPGCGKTLLASAVAQQSGLNFISVKGPEILNKYIGASEQNVRELFEKAQAVKPCILFFDEFDSIAPKRGHDSTGVTDRVVNQLLTQMDGAEGLDGVYVLAATSRPDLIDAALLRPGRLDKSVLCDMPDEDARYDILLTITRNDETNQLKIREDIDLRAIAKETKYYSGADLQSLCYNAYLKSVQRKLENSKLDEAATKDKSQRGTIEYCVVGGEEQKTPIVEEHLRNLIKQRKTDHEHDKEKLKDEAIYIETHDLEEALSETKPSVSTNEYMKLKAVYDKFNEDRDGKMPTGENGDEIGSRLSLM
ncbi:Peroxisomal ATPase PEX1 [Nakaseomyces bracarensis]|uniref:Peroxisomal ATPase PEX1 n=1 Tax=Nakaseomyces bracarensis TaxID=273131 RepID=A0ABR4NSQ6_9SACH